MMTAAVVGRAGWEAWLRPEHREHELLLFVSPVAPNVDRASSGAPGA
ncbi:hypothetical protein [Paenibacillus tepidiphilus]|nr:hypothetical protein [Paenibacillus tepidiphilus]